MTFFCKFCGASQGFTGRGDPNLDICRGCNRTRADADEKSFTTDVCPMCGTFYGQARSHAPCQREAQYRQGGEWAKVTMNSDWRGEGTGDLAPEGLGFDEVDWESEAAEVE